MSKISNVPLDKIYGALEEALDCLRSLADFSLDDTHHRYEDESKKCRSNAYELLKRYDK